MEILNLHGVFIDNFKCQKISKFPSETLLILTHSHTDHLGGGGAKIPKCVKTIFTSELSCQILQDNNMVHSTTMIIPISSDAWEYHPATRVSFKLLESLHSPGSVSVFVELPGGITVLWLGDGRLYSRKLKVHRYIQSVDYVVVDHMLIDQRVKHDTVSRPTLEESRQTLENLVLDRTDVKKTTTAHSHRIVVNSSSALLLVKCLLESNKEWSWMIDSSSMMSKKLQSVARLFLPAQSSSCPYALELVGRTHKGHAICPSYMFFENINNTQHGYHDVVQDGNRTRFYLGLHCTDREYKELVVKRRRGR